MAGNTTLVRHAQYVVPQCAERDCQPAAEERSARGVFTNLLIPTEFMATLRTQSRTWLCVIQAGESGRQFGMLRWLEESKAFRSWNWRQWTAFIVLKMQNLDLSQ